MLHTARASVPQPEQPDAPEDHRFDFEDTNLHRDAARPIQPSQSPKGFTAKFAGRHRVSTSETATFVSDTVVKPGQPKNMHFRAGASFGLCTCLFPPWSKTGPFPAGVETLFGELKGQDPSRRTDVSSSRHGVDERKCLAEHTSFRMGMSNGVSNQRGEASGEASWELGNLVARQVFGIKSSQELTPRAHALACA